jgi:hypothetical protein
VKLLGVILLAGLVSAAIAFGVTLAAIQLVKCRSDAAGCGMATAFQVLFVPVYAIVMMIASLIAMAFRNRLRALGVAALILVGATLMLFVVGLASDASSGRQTQAADIIELLQLLVPFWATIGVQWFVIRAWLNRQSAGASA